MPASSSSKTPVPFLPSPTTIFLPSPPSLHDPITPTPSPSSSSAPSHPTHSPSAPSPPSSPSKFLLRNTIIGLADGLTVPFALTAGLSSLGSSRLVILGGLAELFAGAISMGLGAFLAAATERKRYVVEEGRIRRGLEGMVEKGNGTERGDEGGKDEEEEVYGVFEKFGVGRERARAVMEALKEDGEGWVRFRLEVGRGLERRDRKGEWVEGLTMGLAYFLGGLLPMIPYFACGSVDEALFISIGVTAGILMGFGYVKAAVTGLSHRDAASGAIQTLVVGAMAAGVSYGIVRGVNSAHPV